jgi:anti-sigma factor RsiW
MTCESFEALLALHVEGDLPGGETASVETHLRTCARCREFAAELRESQAVLKELREGDIDASALGVVRERVRASLDRRPAHRRPIVFVGVAAAAAAVIVTVLLLQPRPATRESAEATSPRPTLAPSLATVAPPTPSPVEERAVTRVAAAPKRTTRRVSTAAHISVEPPLPAAPDEEPSLVLNVPTSDPSVVIYWVVDPTGGPS